MSSQGSNAVLVESSYEHKRPILPPKHRYMSNYLNIPHVDAESSTANGNIGVFENGLVESPILSNGDITNAGGIILPVNPPEDDIFIDSQADPFLLVSLRQKPPPRPKFEFLLYLFGTLDIAIVFICSYFSIYNAETANVIITTDTKYRDLFLRTNTIVFEEESNDFSDGLPEEHDNISPNDTPSSLPYYGATDNYNSTSVDKGARI
ncbi:4681_t:CDS:2 [Racocetra fulgida]|uniref:4681_t:CDS:1 n=1 Tax=Racocetra fulgida TaxID=60492 RepID=A0A9N9AQF7_9GLOM|nr:4681_t:CDS:2 [Racocetra fulgida]